MLLKIKKVHPEAKLPSYAYPHDAGMNLYSLEEVSVPKGQIAKIRTGISLEIPEGYVGLCWDRSGLSMKNGIKTLAGVIDAGFRGEMVVAVINLGPKDYTFKQGDKVMQMLIQPVESAEIVEVEELGESERGEKGFGSTGK